MLRRTLFLLLSFVFSSLFLNVALDVSAKEKKGEITFQKDSYDFGSFSKVTIRRVVFVFTNTGNAPVVIQSTSTACTCTGVSYSKKPVMPGKKGYITVYYNGNKADAGHFLKTVDVRSNASNSIVRLTIEGEAQ